MADKNTLNRLKQTHEENKEKNCKLFHTHTHKHTYERTLFQILRTKRSFQLSQEGHTADLTDVALN